MVESASDEILRDAQNVDVAFLVVGDPFGYESTPPSNISKCIIPMYWCKY
jgi:diphthine synthase